MDSLDTLVFLWLQSRNHKDDPGCHIPNIIIIIIIDVIIFISIIIIMFLVFFNKVRSDQRSLNTIIQSFKFEFM